MKVGILGSRGIPNHYGGFEEFAEKLSVALAHWGFDVSVYCSSSHPYKKKVFQKVKLIRCYDPEKHLGLFGQFIYDFNCILDSRKRDFDIIYQLGYTSNGVWQWLLSKNQFILTNMDGMEWKRSKYNYIIREFLKISEKLAANKSDLLIADSPVILEYLTRNYLTNAKYIPYGARIYKEIKSYPLNKYNLSPYSYFLIIARLQPDNHIEEVIKGVINSNTEIPLYIVGNNKTKYGKYLKSKYNTSKIVYLGGIFESEILNALRKFAALYFHGHSVGGTNPSLLEAMASGARICAHDNPFNRSVLGASALYFRDDAHIKGITESLINNSIAWESFKFNNLNKILKTFNWEHITKEYKNLFTELQKT